MKKTSVFLGGVCALIGTLGALTLAKTLKTPAKKSEWTPKGEDERLNQKLAAMIQAETISTPHVYEKEKFDRFHDVLKELFPKTFKTLDVTEIDGNLLLHWKGLSDERPLVLMSHQDVVPAEGDWIEPPFSGAVKDGKIWGRGAADTKCSLMAFFEAVEQLIAQGYVPEQDLYLSSSCTEEWAGDGCPKLVEELKRHSVKPFLVVDEGGGIISDPIAGIKGNFAMVGLFEKGKADVIFTARSDGGHASAPGRHTPIDRLAAFIQDVNNCKEIRVEMEPEVRGMFEKLAPYAPFGIRYLFSNLWLFKPLILKVLPMVSAQAGAMLKTTIAFTQMQGSQACNVLPECAWVGANIRYIPHQSERETLALLEKLAARHDLSMEIVHSSDYTKPVDQNGEAFKLVEKTIETVFPGLPVAPYVMTGATDASFYQAICDSCVRFAPVVYGPEQMKGMHGVNETIETASLPGAVEFYKELIKGNH